MPSLKVILEGGHGLESKFIPNFEELGKLVKQAKDAGFSIALTQGVWDMFHVGHGRYLEEASSFGDILIVGVDSDELTRQMKGDDRPFDRFEERIELLAMLSFVSIIARRDTDQHMYDLIELVQPDVLVMSKTTKSFTSKDKDALKKFCGRIEHLEPKAPPESISTTAKIRRLQERGAQELAEFLSEAVDDALQRYMQGDNG